MFQTQTLFTRRLAAGALVVGATLLPAGAAAASPDPAPGKAQVEYAERMAAEAERVRDTKAQVEYAERVALQEQQPSPAPSTPVATAIPWDTVAVAGLGGAALALAGAFVVVRYRQAHPHAA